MRLGVFGGTFDPPHLGHSILAAEAHAQLSLDRVLWVPAGLSPFKQELELTPAEIRLSMVEVAIGGDDAFALSRVDIDRPGPHYTVDMLGLLGERYPGAELFLLIGTDVLAELPAWHRPEDVLDQCSLAVYWRSGPEVDLALLNRRLPGLSERITRVEGPRIDISSTEIRHRVVEGQPFRYFVRTSVWEIIERQQLYISNQQRSIGPT